MFFGRLQRKSLASTLILRIALISFLSNLILIIILFFWLKYELALKDQKFVQARFHEVIEVLEHEGIHFLNSKIKREEFSGLDEMLIQVFDQTGKLLVNKMPKRMHYFDPQAVNRTLQKSFRRLGQNTIYPKRFGQETIEIFSGKLNQFTVLVGVNTDDSEDFANLFGHNALILLLLTVIFISWVSFFVVQKSLTPIHDLISAIKDVRAGRLEVMSPHTSEQNEIAVLNSLFNEMMKDISKLVNSLQSSLDSIAHDLRTPLMHLRLKVENLSIRQRNEPLLNEVIGDFFDEIQKIEILLSQLLEISQATSGSVIFKREETSLNEIVEEILDIYEYVIEEHSVTIKNHLNDLKVFSDKNKLKRIIANLLDNAIKYGKKEGAVVEFFANESSDGGLDFTVSDNGIGIPKDEFQRIWERLYRVDQSRTSVGVGLGLSLVKTLVEGHNWTIKVESDVGVGSKFIITLPKEDIIKSL